VTSSPACNPLETRRRIDYFSPSHKRILFRVIVRSKYRRNYASQQLASALFILDIPAQDCSPQLQHPLGLVGRRSTLPTTSRQTNRKSTNVSVSNSQISAFASTKKVALRKAAEFDRIDQRINVGLKMPSPKLH
jgi:hypothetical protein